MTRQALLDPDEVLALSTDALALFDPNAALLAASPAFRRMFQPLQAFLAAGTPWPMFLSEAVRHDVFPLATAHRLSMIEESLSDEGAPSRDVIAETAAGLLKFALSATSDGGFALRLDVEGADTGVAEQELEQIMSKVLEACPTCLTMARIGDGHILYRSPEATALLGKGFNSREHFAHREERADFVTELMPNSRVNNMRITARRADGTPFPAEISARLIDYRGEEVIVSSIADLTGELAMQEELDRQRDQVFRSEKMSALGEVLAGVAHELNNPLSIVVGNAQILLEEDIGSAHLKRVEKLNEAAERCVGIVRAFLSMARERRVTLEAMPALELLQTAKDAFEATDRGDVSVSIETSEALPCVLVDEVQMVQVLSNLLTNAEQALRDMAEGHIVMQAALAPSAKQVRFRISDNGPGISPEVAAKIFDPLFTTKEVGKGTGIGLALCHRIVTAHGGTIAFDSAYRDGASFVLDLPAVETNET